MELKGKKITFTESSEDLKTLMNFKKMIEAATEGRKQRERHGVFKDAAYSAVKMFLMDQDVDEGSYGGLEFDEKENCVILMSIEKAAAESGLKAMLGSSKGHAIPIPPEIIGKVLGDLKKLGLDIPEDE